MSTALVIVIVLGCIIALLLIIGLFTQKNYLIEREIQIRKPVTEVFDYVKSLKNQDHYSKWVMMDPGMKKTFSGKDGTRGFIYAWDGNKQAGAGEQEIVQLTEGEKIETEVRFMRPFKGLAYSTISTTTVDDIGDDRLQTTVRWVFKSRLKYPMNLLLLFMNVEKTLGKDIEISLGNLKTIIENKVIPNCQLQLKNEDQFEKQFN